MRTVTFTLPEIGLLAGTRAMLGGGIALLLADRLSDEKRRAVGWTLALVGVVTTVPLVIEILCSSCEREKARPAGRPDESVPTGEQEQPYNARHE